MVSSTGAADASREIVEFIGGILPDRDKHGIGRGSARRGSMEVIVSIPRPTENDNDLKCLR
jgi:hypothetical protein